MNDLVSQQAHLRDEMAASFDETELRSLCLDLNITYEDLPGNTRLIKIIELVQYCQRHGQIEALMARCQALRPNRNWKAQESQSPSEISLSRLDYQTKVKEVEKNLTRLVKKSQADKSDVGLEEMFPILRKLFNRNTFSEPFAICVDENWHDRFIGTIHTLYLLDQFWFQIQSAASKEQNVTLFESYEHMQSLLRSYSQILTDFFQPSPKVSDVEDALLMEGKTEEIRERLEQDRLLVKNVSSPPAKEVVEKLTQAQIKAESIRQDIVRELEQWPKI